MQIITPFQSRFGEEGCHKYQHLLIDENQNSRHMSETFREPDETHAETLVMFILPFK